LILIVDPSIETLTDRSKVFTDQDLLAKTRNNTVERQRQSKQIKVKQSKSNLAQG
jgi:hypothetical protein